MEGEILVRNAHVPTGRQVLGMAVGTFLFGFSLIGLIAAPKPEGTKLGNPQTVYLVSNLGETKEVTVYSSPKGVSEEGLVWPFEGPLASPYGPSHPLGIDIDGNERAWEPVIASTNGEVVFSGGNPCCSYGYYIVIFEQTGPLLSDGFFEMTPGVETLYAHLNRLKVKQGEKITQGQVIGLLGATGYSTGPHLHFEVIVNGVRVDPLEYLP
ncbi:MAG: M23 family metallopeptidase [bacterium]|nr:M23 family metallopeptidase [bacterium]